MSLTNSMMNLTQDIARGTADRAASTAFMKASVATMLGDYQAKRVSDTIDNHNERAQFVSNLKDSVNTLLTSDYDARMGMRSGMRLSLDEFMRNLREKTLAQLDECNRKRAALLGDIQGAKAEWSKLRKKKS